MKLLVTWSVHEDKWMDVLAQWSSLTPADRANVGPGVKLVGRWHSLAQKGGAAVFEATDLAAFEVYSGQWSPVMELAVTPVLDDEESAAAAKQIVAGAGKK